MNKIKTPVIGFLLLGGIATSLIGTSVHFSHKNAIETDATIGNYYDGVKGQGQALRDALHEIISNRNITTYDDLWEIYKISDVRPDGYIMDIYSNTSKFIPGKDQAGNYNVEGDVYNREHCIPKSWWGGAKTNQGADPFIVLPADGYVNNQRSNYAFGEVSHSTYESNNGYSKLGSSNIPGSPATVFEPADEWKGDMARVHFYAATCYNTSGWTDGNGPTTFSSSGTVGLTKYAKDLFLKWHKLDPVSDWERQRNDKVQTKTKNRNPFIDHPEYANAIWENKPIQTTPYINIDSSLTLEVGEVKKINANVENGTGTISFRSENVAVAKVDKSGLVTGVKVGSTNIVAEATVNGKTISAKCPVTVKAPVILTKLTMNKTTDSVEIGATTQLSVTPTPAEASSNVTWSSSDSAIAKVDQTGLVSGVAEGTTTITATSNKDSKIKANCEVKVTKPIPVEGYKLVDSNLDDFNGEYMIGAKDGADQLHVLSNSKNSAKGTSITTYSVNSKGVIPAKTNADAIKLVGDSAGYKITNPTGTKELVHGSGKDYIWDTTGGTLFKVSVNGKGELDVKDNNNYLRFNSQGDYNGFRFYEAGKCSPINLYKKGTGSEGGGEVPPVEPDVPVEPILTIPSSLTLNVGATGSAKATLENATETITYETSNNKVATVTSDGTVKGIAAGYATITAKAVVNGKTYTATCEIKVNGETSNGGYELVSAPESIGPGEYLIASGDNVMKGSMGVDLTGTNNCVTTYKKTGNTFESAASVDAFTVKAATGGGYYLYAGDTVVYSNSTGNNLDAAVNDNPGDAEKVTFTVINGNVSIKASSGTVLKFNANADQQRFRFYKTSSDQQAVQMYKKVETSKPETYGLKDFNFDFLSTVTCDNGVTPPDVNKWNSLKAKYNQLSLVDRGILKSADYTNSDVGAALERYDYIIAKYGDATYENFLNRTIASSHNNSVMNVDTTILIIIAAASVVTCASIIGFVMIIRKRRHN